MTIYTVRSGGHELVAISLQELADICHSALLAGDRPTELRAIRPAHEPRPLNVLEQDDLVRRLAREQVADGGEWRQLAEET